MYSIIIFLISILKIVFSEYYLFFSLIKHAGFLKLQGLEYGEHQLSIIHTVAISTTALYTVRKFNLWRLSLCDEIFYHIYLFDETFCRILYSFVLASSVTYSEIRQTFSNRVLLTNRRKPNYTTLYIYCTVYTVLTVEAI